MKLFLPCLESRDELLERSRVNLEVVDAETEHGEQGDVNLGVEAVVAKRCRGEVDSSDDVFLQTLWGDGVVQVPRLDLGASLLSDRPVLLRLPVLDRYTYLVEELGQDVTGKPFLQERVSNEEMPSSRLSYNRVYIWKLLRRATRPSLLFQKETVA